MSAVETLRNRAAFAASCGSRAYAAHLTRIADKGEQAAQTEIEETRRVGKTIVDTILPADTEGRG